ncbi:MAG: T9SS type A sorting domain-containing protein [Bacteroidales bacterium]|nr:T9SS type A sorting domain-containing protein [Bacteroidales bacterium]
MKSPSFPIILNADSIVFVTDITPNVNDGYPIFGKSVCEVITQNATNVGFASATLNGVYTPQQYWQGGMADVVGFEYKQSANTSYTTVYANVDSLASYPLSGLQSGTSYNYRFFIQKNGVTYYGNNKTFTTQACDIQATVTKSATEICNGENATFTVAASSNYSNLFTFEWNNGSTDSSILVSDASTYTVTVHDTNGCTTTANAAVSVNPLPQGVISGNTSLCPGESSTLTASGANSYHWSTGATAPVITVNSSGTYSCTFTNSYGCTATQSITVSVLDAPIITGSTSFCEGSSTTLTAIGGDSYSWSTGATSASIVVNTPGNYTVTVSSSNGCSGTTSVNVVRNPSVNATITGNTVICSGTGATLTATSGSSYLWSSGETTQSITVSNPATYFVTVTDANGCSGLASQTVSMMEQAAISGNTHICEGESTTLSVSGIGDYSWSNGANTSSVVVSTTGNYTVTVSLPNGCSSTASMNVTVADVPVPTIMGNTTICDGENTTLTANGGNSYLWSNDSTNNTISVTQGGVYTVTVTNADGCSATTNVTVTVNPLPNVSISGSNSFCQGDNITLAASGASTYMWSNTSTSATITVGNAGTYTVSGTDANGCSSTATKTVTVNPTYNIPLTYSICQGESYDFYGQNLTTAGIYTHTLQTVNGCDSVLTLTLTVKALPTPSITGNTTFCQGQNSTLTVTGGNSYLWNSGSTNNNISVSQSGVYTVTATNAEGCSNTTNVTVTVNPLPNVSISGNSSLCQGDNISLTAIGASTYVWSNASTNASITVSNAGTYTVTGADANGCSNTATKTVSVNPTYNVPLTHSICQGENYNFYGQNLTTAGTYMHTMQTVNGCDSVLTLTLTVKALPTPTITGNTSLCEGETTTLTATGGTSYVWGNASTSNSISVSQSGVYTVTATNAEGCSNMTNVTVTVNPLPNVSINGNNSFCQGSSVVLTASGASSYSWSNGSSSATITVSNPGTYTLIGTDANNCTKTASKTVTVNPTYNIPITHSICQGESYNFNGQNLTTAGTYTQNLSTVNGCDSIVTLTLTVKSLPIPVILGNTTLCQGQSTTLTANGGASYTWSNGSSNNNISVSQSGVYTVTATDAEGCSNTANVTVTVNPLPNVSISGNSSFCQGSSVVLTASGASSYSWSNGSSSATITVANPGTYTLIGTDANNCTNTATKTVTANPTYNVPITYSICQGESYNFNGQSLSTAGTYTQNLSTVNGCDSIVTLTLTVKSLPAPVILGNTTLCQGQSTSLSANGGISYHWSNGSTNNNISVSQSGVYTVTATNAEGCSATTSVTVTVNPLPSVNISGNSSFCQGDNVTLTATGANTYVWSNASTNTAITVSSAGSYTVTGTDANGCSNIATKTVSVNPTYNIPLTHSICQSESYNFYGQNLTMAGTYTHTLQTVNGCDSVLTLTLMVKALPTPTLTGNTSLCEGETTTLAANGGVSYVWNNASTGNSISVSQSGVYTVTATNAEGCSAPASVTVTVNLLPNVNINGNNSFCQGDNITLTATGANTYVWSNASTNTSITVSSAGTYSVTGTDANGCTNTATKTVSVNPTYNIPLTHSICQGESYNFYGQNLTTAGTYTHTLQTVNGCDSVLTLTLTVKALPTPTITGNTSLCEGEATTLTANGGVTYAWSNASTGNSISVSQSGVYTVTATNAEGCSAPASITVTVNPVPTITVSGNTTLCAGNSTTLTASGADSYSWSTGDNTASVSISAFGVYTVTGTTTAGCSGTANVTVLVSQLPVITISGETDICAGESTTLTANGGETYLWSDGTTANTLTVGMAGTYQVIGYNAAGCDAMASTTVNVWQSATSEFTIVCPDSCYIWNGESYCQSGDYTQTLQTIHGCDSVVTLHLTITVGIDDHDLAASMTVYPNPTTSVINVQFTMNNVQAGTMEFHVYDAYGKLVDVVVANNDGNTQIDLSHFAPGVYFIKAVTEGNVVAVRKVVKQ